MSETPPPDGSTPEGGTPCRVESVGGPTRPNAAVAAFHEQIEQAMAELRRLAPEAAFAAEPFDPAWATDR